MYNVLIVDDEQEVRLGLKLKMNWQSLGFQVVGEACDGQDALDLLGQLNVHVMITDIKMPVMSGLELIKRASVQYPDLRIVVLSGYDDFHFVKAAMQSAARDYLLKPFVRNELKEIMMKLHEELEADREQRSQLNDDRWRLEQTLPVARDQLLLAMISDEGEEHILSLRNEIAAMQMSSIFQQPIRLRFVSVDMRVPAGRLDEGGMNNGLFRIAFQMFCREIAQDERLERKAIAFHHPGYPDMMYFLIATESEEEEERMIRQLIEQIQSNMKRQLRVETVIAIGEAAQEPASLRSAFQSALMAWSHSKAGAVTQTIYADRQSDVSELMQPDVEKSLLNLIEDTDLEQFMGMIEHILKKRHVSMQELQSFMIRIVLLLEQAATRNGLELEQKLRWLFPVTEWKINSPSAAIVYLHNLAGQVVEGIKRSRVSGGSIVVEGVRQYLDVHYMNEIRLSTLAERFHVNTTYLSELFKKHTGTTFSDYLTQIRIGKAAGLLADPNLRLADIAELVGFANASYLSSVFKKTYGVSPNEYRLQAVREENR